jgi:phospholipid/cholesterol/gamma-HCH transport system permease protein
MPASPTARNETETLELDSLESMSSAQRGFLQIGRKLIRGVHSVEGVGAFALITLGVLLNKVGVARPVIQPMIVRQIARSGVLLVPMAAFLALALGLVVIGQAVSLLSRVGATNFLGTIMVTVVVRELGPLAVAMLVLCRTGTANVVELSTARATGAVEALEAMGVDPIHYLVVPRVIGMAIGSLALTVYLILGALLSGYLWAFVQDVPLTPVDYLGQLVGALTGIDFMLLGLKTTGFGVIIAMVTSYHGLAHPLSLSDVSRSTVRAIGQSIIACVVLDALFLVVYLIT